MTELSNLIGDRFGIETAVSQSDTTETNIENILSRRSFRRYLDREIDEDLRNLLLTCAQSASSKSDLQQYSIIDIREQSKKRTLAEIADSPFITNAPLVLVFWC